MTVVVCRVTLIAHQCHSLKQKRSVVRKLVDRVATRFRVHLVEVGGQQTWQRIQLGFSVTSNTPAGATSIVSNLLTHIEQTGLVGMLECEKDVLHYGDEPFGPSTLDIEPDKFGAPSP